MVLTPHLPRDAAHRHPESEDAPQQERSPRRFATLALGAVIAAAALPFAILWRSTPDRD